MSGSEDGLRAAHRTLARVAPAEFTARREQLVAQARTAGDRALATTIHAIRKPTQSAWAVNLLVHERFSQVNDYVDLGRVLRARHADLTAEELRGANAERVSSVRELVADARTLAAELGVTLSNTHATEVEQTLAAAFSDDDAADAVLAGTLTTGLQYSGLGFGGAVTARRPAPSRAATKKPAPPRTPTRRSRDEVAEVARRRAALSAAVGAVDDAQQRLERLHMHVQEAEQDLAAAQLRVAAAERDLQHAAAEEQRAEQLVEAALAAVETGQTHLAELERRLAELDPD